MSAHTHDLQRFLDAQDQILETVMTELKHARKVRHWMWFIFPQIKGLGFSPNSQFFAIADVNEAIAYLNHSVLGQRLIECCRILLQTQHKTAEQIFGGIDSTKLKSSMTLFSHAFEMLNSNAADNVFKHVLNQYFDGEPDTKTLQILSGH